MPGIRPRFFKSVVAVALLTLSCTEGGEPAPRNVIVLIADGAGVAHWTLAKLGRDELAVEGFPVAGLIDTRGDRHTVSGSGPGATALSTGVRSFMGAVGVGPDSLPRETVLEAAMARGMAAGIITTTWVADATPAAFGAHSPSRSAMVDILRQMAAQRIEVILGGGGRILELAEERDSVDLRGELDAAYTLIESREELEALDLDTISALVGLFSRGDMPRAPEREPSLSTMLSTALTIVSRDPDGFFLMVENEGSDTEAHRNSDREVLQAEMLDFDEAVGLALAFQRDHPETLVVVTADHETGGISLPADEALANRMFTSMLDSIVAARGGTGHTSADTAALRAYAVNDAGFRDRVATVLREPSLQYSTGDHTAALVPLFAIGPGAARFGGLKENREIGALLLEAVRN
jgi:alkaline phosphatase